MNRCVSASGIHETLGEPWQLLCHLGGGRVGQSFPDGSHPRFRSTAGTFPLVTVRAMMQDSLARQTPRRRTDSLEAESGRPLSPPRQSHEPPCRTSLCDCTFVGRPAATVPVSGGMPAEPPPAVVPAEPPPASRPLPEALRSEAPCPPRMKLQAKPNRRAAVGVSHR